jgi:Na+-driven multidrug efflux pump
MDTSTRVWRDALPDASLARIARLAAPLVASSVVVLGSQLAVVMLVGRIGAEALYVRSVYAPIVFLLLAVTTGLAVTLHVASARSVGGGEPDRISGYLGSTARIGLVVNLTIGAVLVLTSGALADLVQVPEAQRAPFRHFLLAMVLVNLVGFAGELCTAVLRGVGMGGTAALFTVTYVLLYLGILAVAGLWLHGGLMSVPLGGGVAGGLELLLGLSVLIRRGFLRHRALGVWRADTVRLALTIGIPIGTSYLVLFVVNLLLLRIVAAAGQDTVAGFAVGYTLQSLVVVPAVSAGSAVAILMNQQLAAGAVDRARTVFRRGLFLVAACYAAVTVLLVVAGHPLVALLSGDAEIVRHAWRFVSIVGPTFGCTGLVLCALTVLEQLGRGPTVVLMNLGYFASIILIGWWVVGTSTNVDGLYLTMAIVALCGLLTGLPTAWRLMGSTLRSARSDAETDAEIGAP